MTGCISFQRMGVDIETYCSHIGSFHQDHHTHYGFDGYTVKLMGIDGTIIIMFLVLSGVETNPGPSGDIINHQEN